MAKKKDPPQPSCKREGCDNPVPEIAIANNDPFCSTSCARIHYGTDERREKLT